MDGDEVSSHLNFRFVVLLPHLNFHICLIRIFRFVGMDGALAWTQMNFGMDADELWQARSSAAAAELFSDLG
jgi:hypothetical protein